MNLRNVLRAFSSLRQLTDDESALLGTLRGMSDTERELLVESLQPEKVGGKKKAPKKGAASGGKSQRASNMAAALARSFKEQDEKRLAVKCTYVMNADESDAHVCEGVEGDPIHDATMGYAGYHEFVAPSAQAASGD